MFWADGVGLPKIVKTLRRLEQQTGDISLHPAGLLTRLAGQNRNFADA
jgi:hypothetical protein